MAAKKDYDKLFNDLITDIIENKVAVRDAIKGRMSLTKFYKLLEEPKKSEQYVRATEIRTDSMASEILEISDNVGSDIVKLADGREVVDHAVVNRDRLRVDARKWLLAKMNPKKYGDKIDVTTKGEPITSIKLIRGNERDNNEAQQGS